MSFDAEMLRPLTLKIVLLPGDRSCLALARREGVPALADERRWPEVAAHCAASGRQDTLVYVGPIADR